MTIKKDDLDFASSSIFAAITVPILIVLGVTGDGDWDAFFGMLLGVVFIYLVLLFSNVLDDLA